MASILNKSTHPVFVKKVTLLSWKLRDEIEFIISKRLADQENPDIEDIKAYYSGESSTESAKTFKREVPISKTTKGEMILSDVNMQSIFIFSEESYMPGQNIGIQFDIPSSFILTCKVETCSFLGRKSKVIGNNKAHHRLVCHFEFHYEEQKDALRDFLKSIEPEIPPGPSHLKSSRSNQADEDEDDFSDLGL